jgi:N-acetylglucosamine-6-phosphate deacetylase
MERQMQTAGLIDLQVNGYSGVDFNTPAITADALDDALHAMLLSGVTTCLPTLITAPAVNLAARLDAIDAAVAASRLGPLMIPGYHLEGPFLCPLAGYAGCHPPDAMVPPDPDMIERLIAPLRRPILLLTLAPERAGAIDLIKAAVGRGIVIAIGHTAAGAEDIARAAAAGAALSTHLGNALPQPQPKFLNPMMAQLAEDRLAASFIADGIHVPIAALKVMIRAKGPGRAVLVTDATAAAAAPPGLYGFAGMVIEHATDGSVRVPGGMALAGSALCLDQAVRNLVAWGIATASEATAMASGIPAGLMAPAMRHHGIRMPPSAVVWSEGLTPRKISAGDLKILRPR